MVRHPFDPCATKYCCFCCDLDPEVACYIIAVICIVINGFSGVTNVGIGHWAIYFFTIFNLLIHLLAGVILFLGTLWGKETLKLAYCWIVFFAIFTVIVAFIVYLIMHKHVFIIWSEDCHKFNVTLGVVVLVCNAIWLLFWDIYTPMVVLGNMSCGEDVCVDENSYD